MPQEIAIDAEQLRTLASDPKNGIKEICAGLGMSDPTFYQQLNRHPDLKQIYQEARDQVRAARNGGEGTSQRASGRKPKTTKRKSSKGKSTKSANRSTPPRNGNAKADLKDLLSKLRLEFEHIAVYEEVSEHFDELRDELAATK